MHKNKARVCITVDNSILAKAKEHKINVSMISQMALERELDLWTRNAYAKALEKQISLHKMFLKSKNLWIEFDEFKFKDVVSEDTNKYGRKVI